MSLKELSPEDAQRATLRNLRETLNVPQIEVALAVGLDTATFSRWERHGVKLPRPEAVAEIAQYLVQRWQRQSNAAATLIRENRLEVYARQGVTA
jgi:transcriptional regulator with XRE-family HTH domain